MTTTTFDSLQLDPRLLKGIHHLGFLHPTPIQAKAIPSIMEGRDLIGCAQTGTGKTAAFVLPILHRLLQAPSLRNPRALIIAPTRELALQSMTQLEGLSKFVPLKGTAIFGGVAMQPQIQALARGVDIVSATPGRLLDHLGSNRLRLEDLQILVLDEVDQMLDMGFLPDIQRLLKLMPKNRQTLFFSATMPPAISDLANQLLKQPVKVDIGRRSTAAVGVRHSVYPVPQHLKMDLLLELLKDTAVESTLIFTRTKRNATRLANRLAGQGFKVSVMHGDRTQGQRMRALEEFRHGHSQIMVATDVAARGIDIQDISHVVNFDIPATAETYIHRIGRTARGGATGDALTFVSRDEEYMIRDIEKTLGHALPKVMCPGFDYKRAAPPVSERRRSPSRPKRFAGQTRRFSSSSR